MKAMNKLNSLSNSSNLAAFNLEFTTSNRLCIRLKDNKGYILKVKKGQTRPKNCFIWEMLQNFTVLQSNFTSTLK